MIKCLFKTLQIAADITQWQSGPEEGWLRWEGGSFLCGDDLQSGSSTGPPFNQRYLNCIVWPLRRALLRDIARPLRLHHFEDIITVASLWMCGKARAITNTNASSCTCFFSHQQQPSVMNRVVVTAKQSAALITDWCGDIFSHFSFFT